jgi:hypothetical protein
MHGYAKARIVVGLHLCTTLGMGSGVGRLQQCRRTLVTHIGMQEIGVCTLWCERLWAVEHLYSHNIHLAISSLLALVTTGPLHEGDGHDD